MQLASWTSYIVLKGFRSFNAENLGSVGQRAAKLQAIKLWEWLNRDRGPNPSRLADWGRGRLADFFLRPPTLTASNFAALWPTEPIFTAFKVLILFSTVSKDQKASSILKVGFDLSKWPYFHSAYVIGVCIFFVMAVFQLVIMTFIWQSTSISMPNWNSQIAHYQRENIQKHQGIKMQLL